MVPEAAGSNPVSHPQLSNTLNNSDLEKIFPDRLLTDCDTTRSSAKKKMSLAFIPARLVKCKAHWYIMYYQTDPVTGKRHRHRETFDINRIRSKKERVKVAQQIVKKINTLLPFGYPYDKDFMVDQGVGFRDTMMKALELMSAKTDRKQTIKGYTSKVEILLQWIQTERPDIQRLYDFGPKDAKAFLRWIQLKRKVGNVTYNNYILKLRSVFNEMIRQDLYEELNPFDKIQKLKTAPKGRRALRDWEVHKITAAAQSHPYILVAIYLQYYCFIRPAELRRMRLEHIDLEIQTIYMTSEISKNRKNCSITIPDDCIEVLADYIGNRRDLQFYLFSKIDCPGPIMLARDRLKKEHDKMLMETGLKTDKSIHFYSWKDTGAIALVRKKVNIREIQLQLRHSSLEDTQKYLESLGFQYSEIRRLDNKI